MFCPGYEAMGIIVAFFIPSKVLCAASGQSIPIEKRIGTLLYNHIFCPG